METVTKKTVTNLDTESVSILTQQFEVVKEMQTVFETQTIMEKQTVMQKQTVEEDGETKEIEVPVEVEVQKEVRVPKEVEVEKEIQIGSNHRCAYSNSESGRALLIEKEPEDIVAEVMEVWGDTPTVEEFKFDDIVRQPTAEERIAHLEETVAMQEDNDAELLYQICLLQLGVTEDEML